MKQILKSILALVCLLALVLAGGERSDGSCDIIWTASWLAVAVVCGIACHMLNKKQARNNG